MSKYVRMVLSCAAVALSFVSQSAFAVTYGPECLTDGGFENCQLLTSVKYAKIGTTDISSPSWTSGNVAKSGCDWLTGVTGLLQGSNCGCIWQYLKLECTFEANETGTYEFSLLSAQRGTYGDAGHETMVSVDGGDPFLTFQDDSKTAQKRTATVELTKGTHTLTLKGGTSPAGKDQSSVYDNISLKYIVPETSVPVPALAATELAYTGENLALTFTTSLENVVIAGVTNATVAGTYSFDATPAAGYTWPDTTTAKKSYTWKVLAAENTWTTAPAISATTFSSTQAAGVTITAGVPKFGEVAATISKDGGSATPFGGTVPTEEGFYALTYTVPASDNWLVLSTTISFRVTPFDITLGSNAFYNLLETNASRVASSPYATGGDYVLKLGPTEYAHVFKSGLSPFTPSQDLNGKVLLIGGGGAGGGFNTKTSNGGGGAGGFVETNEIAFAKGACHYVSIGTGGAGANGDKNGGTGKSSFVEFPGLVEGQVEYVQATGNVCFDTGVTPTYASTIDMKFELDSFDGNTSIFCARRHYESPRNSYTLFAMKDNANWSFHYVDDNTASSTAPAIATGVPYELHAAGGGLWINSTQVGQYTLTSGSPDNNLVLFCSYSDKTTQGNGNYLRGKIYYCRVSNGNAVLLDLVPCVQNNVVGFYDRISRNFKKPSSGTLTAGPAASGKTVEQIVAYGGGGGAVLNSGSNGASGGGGANSSSSVGGTTLYGDQGNAGGVGSGYGGGGGGGAGSVGGDPVGTSSNDPKSHAGDGGDGKASDILGFEQYFAGGGGGCTRSLKRDGNGGLGGGHGGGIAAHGGAGDSMYAGTDGLGGGGGANGNPSNQGCAGRGGKGLAVIRYSVSASGEPSLGAVKLTNAGGSALTMVGTVANSGTSEATVKIKLWPASGTEGGEGTVTEDIKIFPAGKVYVAFEELVSGLDFDTSYRYKCWAENVSGASAVQTGTISTFSKTVVPTAVLTEGGTEVVAKTNGFNWVYTFEKNGSFTIPEGKVALAKLLVVGGGGAGGGWGGGGGAGGGVKYYPTYVLTPGTYPVVVGKGGTHATNNGGANSGGHGGGSGFGAVSVSGGGTGANPAYASNRAGTSEATEKGGSSAGGLGNNAYSYVGTEGQGNAGGNGKATNNSTQVNGAKGYSGGGGGAGTAGENATVEKGGNGGDGYACAITGETKYYGAGGGGSFYCMDTGSAGLGGLGGGGAGGDYERENKNGLPGTFYGAGGGSGALNTSKANAYGGDGYQGVVIVVLTDYSQAGGAPILEVSGLSEITETSAKVAVNVPSAGGGATVRLTAYWGYEAGDYTVGSRVLAEKMIGEGLYTLDGLSPNRAYFLKVVADNGTGGEEATAEVETDFTTAAGLNPTPGNISNTQANYTFKYTVSALGDGVNTGYLIVSDTIAGLDTAEPAKSWNVEAAGVNLSTTHLLNPVSGGYTFGKRYYSRIVLVNEYGEGLASTNVTGYSEFVLSDNATYTWKGETGYWNDASKWTCSVEGSVESESALGYPVYGSYARFANDMTTTVLVARAERCLNVNYEYTGLDLTVRGTAEGAKIQPNDASPGAGGSTFFGANSTYLFDGVEVFLPFWSAGSFPKGASATFVNGAKATANRLGSSWEYVLMQNSGSSLSLKSGSRFLSGRISAAGGNEISLDGGVYEINNNGTLDLASVSGRSAAALSFGADGSRVTTKDIVSTYAPATITFALPKDGYATTPIQATGKLAETGETIALAAPKKLSPIRAASGHCDFRVARFNGGINTNNVVFGATVNGSSYFYFKPEEGSDKVKEIWYHYQGGGLAIIIR